MKKKWLWLGSGIIAVLLMAVVFYIATAHNQRAEQPAMEQNTTQAAKGDILVSVSGAGSVITTESETVRTKDEGIVDEVKVKAGDVVAKGQVLLTFEADDLSDSIAAKESSLETEQLNLEELQEKFKREVHEGGSEDSLASIKLSITKQEKSIQNIVDEIASLKEDMIAPDPLTAPIDGTVTTINISSGERAKEGNELFTIMDYKTLSAMVSIDELDIPKVQIGMRAEVTLDAIPDQVFTALVADIANEGKASGGVSLFDVTVKLDEPESIRAGMSAEVTIILEEKKDVLTLPIEAVQQMGEDYMVLLPAKASSSTEASAGEAPAGNERNRPSPNASASESGSAPGSAPESGREARGGSTAASQMQKVEVGVHDETSIEIISGLQEGDEVVIPTIRRASSSNTQGEQRMMPGGGMSGSGMSGGGFSGGSGGMGGVSGGMPSGGGMSGGEASRGSGGGGF
ncbi:efflux RND transporter periplasmic adaptor subunit [Paenibacillus bouchesdurhonensis]|uniref:efflux RND transporter periplasmic adaptor subunit n=1 Tax=Paenibacillus bouchesdurhonensis TaxID=1870990 RepID=UPI0019020CC8|nr:efflux RND transporter periplasmic adaptor subunit [Paenibacillus bouchesdurhonensis]